MSDLYQDLEEIDYTDEDLCDVVTGEKVDWEVPDAIPYLELPEEDEEEETEEIDKFSIQRKYELTEESKWVDTKRGLVQVYRIKAVRDFSNIREGQLGGWIQEEINLSHEGNCWVYDNAMLVENAAVFRDAIVREEAVIGEDATVTDNAIVSGNAIVRGAAVVEGHAEVRDHAVLDDNASVSEFASVEENAVLSGYARLTGNARAAGYSVVLGDTWMNGHVSLFDDTFIGTDATLDGYSVLYDKQAIIDGFNTQMSCALSELKLSTKDYKQIFGFWDTEFTWRVREGKPFFIQPHTVVSSANVHIAHLPYTETQKEGFNPLVLFATDVPKDDPELDNT